jgi:hypothetical protein
MALEFEATFLSFDKGDSIVWLPMKTAAVLQQGGA